MGTALKLYLVQRLLEWGLYVAVVIAATVLRGFPVDQTHSWLEWVAGAVRDLLLPTAIVMIFSGYVIFAASTSIAFARGWRDQWGFVGASILVAVLTSVGWVAVYGSPIEVNRGVLQVWSSLMAVTGIAAWLAHAWAMGHAAD